MRKKNKNVSIFAHELKKGLAQPICLSSFPGREKTAHIVLVNDNHWLPVVKLNVLYKNGRRGFFGMCRLCCKSFYHKERYERHLTLECGGNQAVQYERVPDPPVLAFKDFDKTVEQSYVMYADIEAVVMKNAAADADANTVKTHVHVPIAIGSVIISRVPKSLFHENYLVQIGVDCIIKFIEYVEFVCRELWVDNASEYWRQVADRTKDELKIFNESTICYMCNKILEPSKKHFDHDHVTGKFRGAAVNHVTGK